MNTERFAINNNDYFEVSVFRYNNEPFVNLRSIHAHIDGHDYDRSDNDMRNEIMNHLRERSNVDHINYISERLNHSRWFNTAYLNQETVPLNSGTDIPFVLPDVSTHNYNPEQLIQSLLVITPEEYEMDDVDNLAYYPIYKFFGRKNALSTIHCVHFDVLVYILMNRFPRIRADLTRLLTIELEIANTRNMNIEEFTQERFIHLQQENERLRGENANLLARVDHLINQNNQLQETIDELYNMNLTSGVTIRSMDKKVNNLVSVGKAIHDQISAIKVKDIKQHKTNDVLILYTSAEKPKDNELREHTPEGCIWIATFNGQSRNFRYPNVPKDRNVIFESNSNRLDSFRSIIEKPNVSSFIRQITPQRNMLIRIDQQEDFIQVLRDELDKEDNYPIVNNLEEATVEQISNEEIEFKRNLLQHYNPCLINLNRYKRRIYANINNELVLVEEVQNPEDYEWMYRYGPNGSKFGKLDLDVLRSSRFTNELETRINYE